ncbi:hypothetical protein, conserved [Eimeria praecox]|uniref:Uncharacterized protein n=1 Tax=Eimeria praecox TaxID=51316 RepID=U6H618_9EIME|nr:hypothetical protein, conserved [Eimeria praecox]
MRRLQRLMPLLLLLLLLILGSSSNNSSSNSISSSSSSSNSSSSSSSMNLITAANAERLQAGINIDDQDKAQKGFIVIWMSIALVFVLVLGVWITLKIADVTDPLLHTKFLTSR